MDKWNIKIVPFDVRYADQVAWDSWVVHVLSSFLLRTTPKFRAVIPCSSTV